MSNISRRNFLKGAGVAALAVAAAGVLAGCSDKDPIPSEEKKEVTLAYYSRSEGKTFDEVKIEVGTLVDTISFETILANKPADTKDFSIIDKSDRKIPADNKVWIDMKMNATAKPQTIKIKYMEIKGTADPKEVATTVSWNWTKEIDVYGGGNTIDTSKLTLDGGYKVAEVKVNGEANGTIVNGVATVYVMK